MAERVERVAFLGLGTMGRRMAANLRRAGFEVVAWNRTRERAEELAEEHGVEVAATPAEAAADADATITMVVDAPQVDAVLFGTDGAAGGLDEGGLLVDMTTIAPSASRAIAERLRREASASFLDAPVTGSRPKAEDGTLTIMVGGERRDFDRALPAFRAMGELILHVGPQGHGSMIKLINNTLAAINAAALAQALHLARAAELDPEAMLKVVAAGSGNSAMVDLKAEAMLAGDYDPLFKLDHMLKDVRHCLREARELGVELDLAAVAERLYVAASGAGLGDSDFAAVMEVAGRGP
jgi:3-hydroxyisobutyrate dehydrogenase